MYYSFIEKTHARFSDRETFDDELNFLLIRFIPLIYSAFVLGLIWIPLDLIMHPMPTLTLALRLGLVVVSIGLALGIAFSRKLILIKPRINADILSTYAIFSVMIITVTAGDYIAVYSSGFVLAMMLFIGVTSRIVTKITVVALAFVLYFIIAFFVGVDLLTPPSMFIALVFSSALVVTIYSSWVLNRHRYETWQLFRSLKKEVELNKKNIVVISDLMQKAEESSRAKSSFLAKMSHEIRTPMNAIVGITEVALREEMSESMREHILVVRQSSAALLTIINDILDFSKIESGKMDILSGKYSPLSLINDVLSMIKIRLIDSNVHFVTNLNSNIPSLLMGDEVRIRQILLNILSNAVKYTEEGYIILSVSRECEKGNQIVFTFEIKDSGRGIKSDDLEHLFDEFIQFDLQNSRGIEGTGLGLAITKNLVDAMSGTISAESEFGLGSTFTVKIPQEVVDYTPIASIDNPDEKKVLLFEPRMVFAESIMYSLGSLGVSYCHVTNDKDFCFEINKGEYNFAFIEYSLYDSIKEACREETKTVLISDIGSHFIEQNQELLSFPTHTVTIANCLNGKGNETTSVYFSNETYFIACDAKILIVDDIETNLFVTKGLLKPYEMQVILAGSGKRALELIEENIFDIILMDHMMPVMDGIETAKRIREHKNYKNIPIIALTANAISGVKEMFLENNFDDCLFKPIVMTEMNACLEKWLPKDKQIKSIGANNHIQSQEQIQGIKIKGISVEKGLMTFGGDIDNYRFALNIFSREALQKIEEIKECLNNKETFATKAHALKGACANIGADELAKTASGLETASLKEDFDFIIKYTPDFLSDLQETVSQIKTVIQPSVQPSVKPNDELNLLRTALEEFDLEAIDTAISTLSPFADIDGISEILENVLSGDYDAAISCIDRM